VAHHSGVETNDAYDALRTIDQQFARLENAAKEAPRPYHFVILSDHGQSGGNTFKQRYGKTLEDFVQELAKDKLVQKVEPAGESASNVNVFLSDATQHVKGRNVKKVLNKLKRHTVDDKVSKENKSEKAIESKSKGKKKKDELPRIVVLASGNLGLVYGTHRSERVTLEEMEKVLPGMIEGLVAHEGVGFAMVHSKKHGPVVIGDKGRAYLTEDRVEGENPLKVFGPRAATHLIREDTFPNCPDILVNSFYNTRKNEVAAFEELIGCHGGMGGYQTQPFLLHPTELKLKDKKPLIGATAVHHLMKDWVTGTDVAPTK
jgi:putative membrane protein